MKQLLAGIALMGALGMTGLASAETATWDRNSEPDMKDYQVWVCFAPSCIVSKSAAQLQGTVNQPTSTTAKPQYVIDLSGKEGAMGVSARDQTLNESGLSNIVTFDKKAPSNPTGLLLP